MDIHTSIVTPEGTEINTTGVSLTGIINDTIKQLEIEKEALKLLNNSYKQTFENDAEYKTAKDAYVEAQKVLKARKAFLAKDPAVTELVEKIDAKKADVQELNGKLSDYLKGYVTETKQLSFEDYTGTVWYIEQSYKLSKSRK